MKSIEPSNCRYLKLGQSLAMAHSVSENYKPTVKANAIPPAIKRVGIAKSNSKPKGMSRDRKIALFKISIGVFGFLSFLYWLIARNRKFEDDVAILTSASCVAIVAISSCLAGSK